MPKKEPASPIRLAAQIAIGLNVAMVVLALLLVPLLNQNAERIRRNAGPAVNVVKPSLEPSYLVWGVWQRFDTLWYRQIAESGYTHPKEVGFYPLYPALIRATCAVGVPSDIGALLVARIAMFFFLWGLIGLLRLDFAISDANFAVALLLAWPMAFVLMAGYAESTLMAATVWAILLARREQWAAAAACAALAALSRAAGAFTLVPLLWLAWKRRAGWRSWPVLLAVGAPLAHPLYLKLNGLMLPGEAYPIYWNTTVSAPWVTITDAFRYNGAGPGVIAFNGIALALFALVLALRPVRLEYLLYGGSMLLFLLTANARPPLHSVVRYLLPVFPAFASATLLARHPAVRALLWLALAVLQIGMVYAFWDWYFLV
jgi:hypothetical protein